jgi:hypothetical protein
MTDPKVSVTASTGGKHDGNETLKLALLWPRDAPKCNAGTPKECRLNRVFEEMAALGIEPEPALYADDVVDRVQAQLLACDGVLVWVLHF